MSRSQTNINHQNHIGLILLAYAIQLEELFSENIAFGFIIFYYKSKERKSKENYK